MKYISDLLAAKRFGVSRATIWRWSRDSKNQFPKPIRLNGSTRWLLEDLEAWEAKQGGSQK